MRPLGAIYLGAYVDSIGRRKGLIVTLAIMAIGTVIIAVTPGYATIGVAAPIIVVLGRLLQGFSAGVELGGVSVYLAEIAKPGTKGFVTSFQSASQQIAVFVAALIGYVVSRTLAPDAITAWGWRIPFLIGCMIVPLIFILRGSLQETPEFLAKKIHPKPPEIYRAVWANLPTVALGMLMVMLTTVSFYFITVYTPDFGKIAESLAERRAAGDVDRGVGQFLLAADRRRGLRPARPKARAARGGRADARIGLSGPDLARRGAELRETASRSKWCFRSATASITARWSPR